MTDSEKFAAFKQQQVTANQQAYGDEARQRYGQAAVTASQRRFTNLSAEAYQDMQATEQALIDQLRQVSQTQDLASPEAHRVYQLHRQWLCFTWNNYTPRNTADSPNSTAPTPGSKRTTPKRWATL
ncbi:TipAS antibiotic-recognition domain-containing protein [Levilactobacillus namurensis]|uniref:TipAS antibiotic-recognition domain-containing protein n=1 Tax=Levilactobacillus namurensis TaxID=380393 RepID=UPI0004AF6EB6|nr:TipAS antibiotic-recognition domain-containing protein [Levilactobacillus namurensis]